MTFEHRTNILDLFKNRFFILAVILLITIIAFSNSIKNDFTNWDDQFYVINNNYIKDFSWQGFKDMFTAFYVGNYHPLTAITNAVEYKFFGLNPYVYHLFNLFFHLCNVILVFYFILLLSQRLETAAIVSVFFAVHPMHVESVAWISERKDVLYSFFYLAGLIVYLRHTPSSSSLVRGKKSFSYQEGFRMMFTFFLFILSCLSKSAAVSFPVLLLLIDYFYNRKITLRIFLEKAPFFVVSIIFGIVAIYSQKSSGAMNEILPESLTDKIVLPFYAIGFYIMKLFFPMNLCILHFYSSKINGWLPVQYYLSIIPVTVLIYWIYKLKNKDLIFGFLFFLITIGLVLQIIPVGYGIVAERFTYIPYIGLLFIIGQWYSNLKKHQSIATIILGLGVIVFSFLTYQRNFDWRNGVTLFSNVIENNPFDINKEVHFNKVYALAFNNRAVAKEIQSDYTGALADYELAIRIDSKYTEAYFNKGSLNFKLKNYTSAIEDFNYVIQLNDRDAEAYFSRGAARLNSGYTKEGCDDLRQSLELGYVDASNLIQQYCK